MSFEVRRLVKSYGGVAVLKRVDLAVNDGEIHALLGANGAGKSTLIKCVGGAIAPDDGEIVLGGRVHGSLTPKEAREAGVAVIYQDFSLAASLTVTENIFLGQELRWGPFVRRRAQAAEAQLMLDRLGASIRADAVLSDLRGASLQIVEIVKALRRSPSVLILDEPTASLTEAEVKVLSDHLRSLKARNLPILYVTHRLGEVFTIADRVTVLRDGAVILSAQVEDITRQDLVAAIAGQAAAPDRPGQPSSRDGRPERPLLAARGLLAPGIGPIDIAVQPGEVLGVFGLLGSGRTELLEGLAGARRASRGQVLVEGEPRSFEHPADAIVAGIALVPSDRFRNSIFPTLPSLDNLLLPGLRQLAAGIIRRRGRERRTFSELARRLNLQPPRPGLLANRFSGGNQQKLSLGRWFRPEQVLRVLLLDEPTQGVDVGARAELYQAIRETVAGGTRAAVMTSSEPEELVLLADRVAVLSRGRLVGELHGSKITERGLLELAHHGE